MSAYEYKTVALSRSVEKRPRRKQSDADLVAEQLGIAINEEAVDGWEYMRAERLVTPARDGFFRKGQPGDYIVLIFRRARSAVWRRDEAPAEIARAAAAQQAQETPLPQNAPPREPDIASERPTPPAQAAPELRIASTSARISDDPEPEIGEREPRVTPMPARPPVGSATD